MNKNMGFRPNNPSNRFKHFNLINFLNSVYVQNYVEFHAGEGISDLKDGTTYNGSPIQAIQHLELKNHTYHARFHESDYDNHQKLIKSLLTTPYKKGDIRVLEKWEDSFASDYSNINSNWFFLIDPTKITDYTSGEDITLLEATESLLNNGANLFLYAPQTPRIQEHTNIIEHIKSLITQSNLTGLDLFNLAGHGYHKRHDHNILASNDKSALEKVTNLSECGNAIFLD